MEYRTTLTTFALLAWLLTGCSSQPSAGANRFTDLGVVNASDGVATRHVLADGRTCVITPMFYNDGKAKLSMVITWTNASDMVINSRSLKTQIPVDRTTLLSMGNDTLISLSLHEAK